MHPKIFSHCFDFVLQVCLGEWDRASARLPTYLCHRGSGQDVVQENWILKKNDFFFFFETNFLFFFFFGNKRWSFEQPFWQIKVFKNRTNLFENAFIVIWGLWAVKFPLTKQGRPSVVWFKSHRRTWETRALPKFNAAKIGMLKLQGHAPKHA